MITLNIPSPILALSLLWGSRTNPKDGSLAKASTERSQQGDRNDY